MARSKERKQPRPRRTSLTTDEPDRKREQTTKASLTADELGGTERRDDIGARTDKARSRRSEAGRESKELGDIREGGDDMRVVDRDRPRGGALSPAEDFKSTRHLGHLIPPF